MVPIGVRGSGLSIRWRIDSRLLTESELARIRNHLFQADAPSDVLEVFILRVGQRFGEILVIAGARDLLYSALIDYAFVKSCHPSYQFDRRARLESAAHRPFLIHHRIDATCFWIHYHHCSGVIAQSFDGCGANLHVFARGVVSARSLPALRRAFPGQRRAGARSRRGGSLQPGVWLRHAVLRLRAVPLPADSSSTTKAARCCAFADYPRQTVSLSDFGWQQRSWRWPLKKPSPLSLRFDLIDTCLMSSRLSSTRLGADVFGLRVAGVTPRSGDGSSLGINFLTSLRSGFCSLGLGWIFDGADLAAAVVMPAVTMKANKSEVSESVLRVLCCARFMMVLDSEWSWCRAMSATGVARRGVRKSTVAPRLSGRLSMLTFRKQLRDQSAIWRALRRTGDRCLLDKIPGANVCK